MVDIEHRIEKFWVKCKTCFSTVVYLHWKRISDDDKCSETDDRIETSSSTPRTKDDGMGEIKTVLVDQITHYAFAAKGRSNHYVVIDSEYDGEPAAASGPMEMILAALGSCTGSDVVEILRKKRQAVQRFSIRLEGERIEEHPRVYKKIMMTYILEGTTIDPNAVERAIELSLSKYCSVHGMLSKSVEITHTYEIHEPKG